MTIYPEFDELAQLRLKAFQLFTQKSKSSMSGDYLSSFRGHGMEFDEVRQYVAGDDVRKIDWRITAKTNKPHIKLFREERGLELILCVDMNRDMRFGTRGTVKSVQAARCAAFLAWCGDGDNVGGYLFGDIPDQQIFLRPKRSRQSIWSMLKTLASKDIDHGHERISVTSALDFLAKNAKTESLVFVISDFINLDDEFKKQLCYLSRKCRVVLLSVNDPADEQIPESGDILFANSIEKTLVSTDSKVGREQYYAQWIANREEISRIAKNLGVNIVEIRTNRDMYYDLFYGLKRIACRQ